MTTDIATQQIQQGEIILYQPDETVRLEVRLYYNLDVIISVGASFLPSTGWASTRTSF